MADARQRGTIGGAFRALLRCVGLVAAFAGVFALVFHYSTNALPQGDYLNYAKNAFNNALANPTVEGVMLAIGLAGAAVAVVWIVLELLMGLATSGGGKAAIGGNIYAQAALAILLVAAMNVIAFKFYKRYDCTRDSQFTLPQELVDELKTLSNDSPTDVVVLKLHKNSITSGSEPDNVDKAAELKIVEKVNDLVDQLRELGPRFRVTVLDRQDEYYADKVDAFPENLRIAMANAPEDSIFFHAHGRVRRMSFNEFYRVDRTASQVKETVKVGDKEETRTRTTNLVLLPQGRENFVKRILSLEQRTPKIALLVPHRIFTSRNDEIETFSAVGLRQSLLANGFEVEDIVFKLWDEDDNLIGDTTQTFEETELDRLENETNLLEFRVKRHELLIEKYSETKQFLLITPLEKLLGIMKKLPPEERMKFENEADLQKLVKEYDRRIGVFKSELVEIRRELSETEPKYLNYLANEKAVERSRMKNIGEKLDKSLAECDLLIIPRHTIYDLVNSRAVGSLVYRITPEQVNVVKKYLKSGKPVMACFGPNAAQRGIANADDLEKLINELGIDFDNRTVLTEEESRAIAKAKAGGLGEKTVRTALVLDFTEEEETNAVRRALLTISRGVNGDLGLNFGGPRPIRLKADARKDAKVSALVLQSVRKSWDETRPLRSGNYLPNKDDDKVLTEPGQNPDAEKNGPFPIGVAFEATVPKSWYGWLEPEPNDGEVVRLAVYGHGGLFTGKTLSTAQEQLLLCTLHWQLGREEYLPAAEKSQATWQFPRVNLSESQKKLWHWSTLLGLPMLCILAGFLMMLTRRGGRSGGKPAPAAR